MGDVVQLFQPSAVEPEEDGPPPDTTAWACNCGSMAFYMTETETKCWSCHAEQALTR